MLFSLTGAIILFSFPNLVTLFLGIEVLSIPLYVMAGSNKTDLRSSEASIKYFLMGAFATGFLLFGTALVYGSTGTFDIAEISAYSIVNSKNTMFVLGIMLMLICYGIQSFISTFPHVESDVYQGSPSIITAFMASVVKIAGFLLSSN
jgi:NADH-quinone oxidoreductase subunit N